MDGKISSPENEINPLEEYREKTLDYLESTFPVNPNKFTSQDALNLSLVNATLAVVSEFPETTAMEQSAVISGLKMEREKIIDKLTGLIAYQTLTDALMYPTDEHIQSGLQAHSEILNKVAYLEGIPEDTLPENYPLYTNYDKIVNNLVQKLRSGESTKEERLVALELSIKASRFGNWINIAKNCMDIIENGAETGTVEQLLQNIHQGGYENITKSDLAARPILDHVADRPWEVANTLTFTFAGYPWLSNEKIKSSVLTWVQPNRELPIIKEYFSRKDIDVRMLEGATKGNKFLQASLSLARQIPISEIEHADFFIDPFSASDIIEGKDIESQNQLDAGFGETENHVHEITPSIHDDHKKYAEQLTPEEIKQELIKIGDACRIIRTLTQHPDHNFFGIDQGFPQQQGQQKDVEAYFSLKTGDVLKGFKAWVEMQNEGEDILMTKEKQTLLYALDEGYEILKGYYGIDEADPWNETATKISRIQTYKDHGFPKESDIQSTMSNIRAVRSS
ncbi:hypothetical protein A2415_03840 [candidate division WWE3 bacterium RIFOXYC1_FULL_39_7]|uniref:Uncharacterized protein n=2 Tax=Katanobacteria TaxID=422282 RepID=A0A1F4X929_UNCKA|nr:MAG: hypothetical protein A2415_03840 [candidate division WWE3 bacterium RIFOXYC1_FULL_39_7]OGC78186.1 MAG: hypothetical protein A2619_01860 [candidate division WWE3 bacterium RIFOXYD1_FULL_39_9]